MFLAEPVNLDEIPQNDSTFIIFGPFVIAEGVLGIPKTILHGIFQSAVRELDNLVQTGSPVSNPRLMELSTIVCLMTVENLTAINLRKRYIQGAIDQDRLVRDDLRWLEVLFTSELHKHTKSPMLWEHRRWLFRLKKDPPNVDCEMELVFKAGELHPKNYYAWSYARWLVRTCCTPNESTELLSSVFTFCRTHVSDISAWMFLHFLLEYQESQDIRLNYLQLSLSYMSIVPGHEAPWAFLRVVTGQFFTSDDTRGLDLLKSATVDPIFLVNTLKWIAMNS